MAVGGTVTTTLLVDERDRRIGGVRPASDTGSPRPSTSDGLLEMRCARGFGGLFPVTTPAAERVGPDHDTSEVRRP